MIRWLKFSRMFSLANCNSSGNERNNRYYTELKRTFTESKLTTHKSVQNNLRGKKEDIMIYLFNQMTKQLKYKWNILESELDFLVII